MKKHAFISYVREDADRVDRLCSILEDNGVKVWLDRDDILPGMRWKAAIRKAITEGAFFLACFSAAYSARSRSYMNEELELALDELRQRPRERAFFIPIIISPTEVPDLPISGRESIKDLQWVDLAENWEGGVKRVLEALLSVDQLPFMSLPDALEAVREAEKQLKAQYPEVSSIALDRKNVGAGRTTEWCIRVYVTKKLPLSEIERPLPVRILDLPVDVVEEGSA